MKVFKLAIYLSLQLFFLVSQAQINLSQSDANLVISLAEQKVQSLGESQSLLGASFVDGTEKAVIRQNIIDNIILNEKVVFSNDLDPTNTTSKEFEIETYLRNVSLFFPDETGVDIQLNNITSHKKVYWDKRQNIYFVKVEAERMLKGNFNDRGEPLLTENQKKLDYYVRVNFKNGEIQQIGIFSMTFHRDNNAEFKEVSILATQKDVITASQRMVFEKELDDIRHQLDRYQKQISHWKKLASREEKLRLGAEKQANEAKRLQQQAEENARQASLLKQQAEKQAAEDKKLRILADQQKQKETTLRIKAEVQASQEKTQRETAEKQKREAEKQTGEAKKLKREADRIAAANAAAASQNKIALQLGAGGSLASNDLFAEGGPSETFNSFFGTAILSLRLSQKVENSTSWAFFGKYGYNSYSAISNYLDGQISRDLEEGVYFEVETGLLIKQVFRLSGGVGQFNYGKYQDPVLLTFRKRKKSYFVFTSAITTPSIKNTVVLGLALSLLAVDLRADDFTNLDLGNAELRPRANFFLTFQIQ